MLKAESNNNVLKSSSQSVSSLPPPQAMSYRSNYDKYMHSGKEAVSHLIISSM